jgi:phenylpyruvate tautomerase PptA (4-oxalocrotonate tautomerase family)
VKAREIHEKARELLADLRLHIVVGDDVQKVDGDIVDKVTERMIAVYDAGLNKVVALILEQVETEDYNPAQSLYALAWDVLQMRHRDETIPEAEWPDHIAAQIKEWQDERVPAAAKE